MNLIMNYYSLYFNIIRPLMLPLYCVFNRFPAENGIIRDQLAFVSRGSDGFISFWKVKNTVFDHFSFTFYSSVFFKADSTHNFFCWNFPHVLDKIFNKIILFNCQGRPKLHIWVWQIRISMYVQVQSFDGLLLKTLLFNNSPSKLCMTDEVGIYKKWKTF